MSIPEKHHTRITRAVAYLHPDGRSSRYSVIFNDELIVSHSRNPECDAARAVLAKGITGKLTILDGKTGTPRLIIDIQKAARLCVKEGPLRFAPFNESRPDRAPAPETKSSGRGHAPSTFCDCASLLDMRGAQ